MQAGYHPRGRFDLDFDPRVLTRFDFDPTLVPELCGCGLEFVLGFDQSVGRVAPIVSFGECG